MQNLKLLLVDDEERFLSSTKILLEKRGVEAYTANCGKDALKIIETENIDVVILDVKMPEQDGIEVLSQIKVEHPMVQVILLTGHASVESAVDGLKIGAFDYLMKPCDINILLEKANKAAIKKRVNEEKDKREKLDNILSDPLSILDKTE
jgi:DNA-binding NtrC family response regulator